MLKVNSKANKPFMIAAAVERGLFPSNKDAEKKTQKELYALIKEWDEKNQFTTDETVQSGNESNKAEEKTTATSPEKTYKYYSLHRPVSIGTYPKDGFVSFDNYNSQKEKCGRKIWAELIYNRELTEKELNDYELVADMVVENDVVVSDISNNEIHKLTVDTSGKTKEETAAVNKIVDTFNMLCAELEASKQVIEKLKVSNKVLTNERDNALLENKRIKTVADQFKSDNFELNKKHKTDANEFANVINSIANTKDVQLLPIWSVVKTCFDKLFGDVNNEINTVVLDMEKLIQQCPVDGKPEDESVQEQEGVDVSEYNYEGIHISYIDGKSEKPDKCSQKQYKEYMAWYDDAQEWVEYIAESVEAIEDIVGGKTQQKKRKELESEIREWYDDWYESCDEITVDMVKATVEQLLVDADVHKAMSDLTAIIDELEF